jgi:hypothetical protein
MDKKTELQYWEKEQITQLDYLKKEIQFQLYKINDDVLKAITDINNDGDISFSYDNYASIAANIARYNETLKTIKVIKRLQR